MERWRERREDTPRTTTGTSEEDTSLPCCAKREDTFPTNQTSGRQIQPADHRSASRRYVILLCALHVCMSVVGKHRLQVMSDALLQSSSHDTRLQRVRASVLLSGPIPLSDAVCAIKSGSALE